MTTSRHGPDTERWVNDVGESTPADHDSGAAPARPPDSPAPAGGASAPSGEVRTNGHSPAGVRVLAQRYHLIAAIGRGTGGVVWEGYDLTAHRKVALKEIALPPDMPEKEREIARERAQREAQAIAALQHPNVVAFYDLLDVGGNPWVVMELLQARSLADAIREQGPLPPQRVATIGLAVLAGLEAAHGAGITHRDVKPGNIMLTDGGRVKLTDFGIARVDGASTITETGTLVGSPSYIPPEVLQGATPGPGVDLWGLGASLFAALEARAPFDAGDPMATLQAVVNEPTPVPPHAGLLMPVVTGLLAKDPRRRLGTVQARHLLLDAARAYDRQSMADSHRRSPERAMTRLPLDPDATIVMSRVVNGQAPPETPQLNGTHRPVPETPAAEPAEQHLDSEDTATLPVPGLEPEPAAEPRPERTDRDHRSGTRTIAALLVALLFVGVFGYGAYLVINKLTGGGDDSSAATPPPAKTSAPAKPPASRPRPNTPASSAFVPYTDPSGFTVQLPKGWTKETMSTGVTDFNDPGADRFVRLVNGLTPPGDLVGAFESGERDFQTSHPGYHRIALGPVAFRGVPAA
ncbi:MAG TPA: serine/threonine-protein kinase, partial [Mycobacteriales bacterium]|nr:serine/threonine-protein kinase [Mycobacteriales bacterium]